MWCKIDSTSKKFSNNNSHFKNKLPLLLSIISIVIGIVEGLTAPMFFGIYEICASIIVVIIGGIIGLYLMKKEEYLISAGEFIAIAIVQCWCLGSMGFYGTILFIITAISLIYLKGKNYSNKKLFSIPILTVILTIVFLVVAGGVSFISNQNAIEIGNITQNMSHE